MHYYYSSDGISFVFFSWALKVLWKLYFIFIKFSIKYLWILYKKWQRTQDEIISTSVLQKSCKGVLDSLLSGEKEKVAIARNNKIEAIIIPVEDFEMLDEYMEREEIADIIQKKKKKKKKKKRFHWKWWKKCLIVLFFEKVLNMILQNLPVFVIKW